MFAGISIIRLLCKTHCVGGSIQNNQIKLSWYLALIPEVQLVLNQYTYDCVCVENKTVPWRCVARVGSRLGCNHWIDLWLQHWRCQPKIGPKNPGTPFDGSAHATCSDPLFSWSTLQAWQLSYWQRRVKLLMLSFAVLFCMSIRKNSRLKMARSLL